MSKNLKIEKLLVQTLCRVIASKLNKEFFLKSDFLRS